MANVSDPFMAYDLSTPNGIHDALKDSLEYLRFHMNRLEYNSFPQLEASLLARIASIDHLCKARSQLDTTKREEGWENFRKELTQHGSLPPMGRPPWERESNNNDRNEVFNGGLAEEETEDFTYSDSSDE